MSAFTDTLISIVVIGGFFLIIYSGYRKQSVGDTIKQFIEWLDNMGGSKDEIIKK